MDEPDFKVPDPPQVSLLSTNTPAVSSVCSFKFTLIFRSPGSQFGPFECFLIFRFNSLGAAGAAIVVCRAETAYAAEASGTAPCHVAEQRKCSAR